MRKKYNHFKIHEGLYDDGPVVHALIAYNSQPDVVRTVEQNRRSLSSNGAKLVNGQWFHTTIVAMPGLGKDDGIEVAERVRPVVGAILPQRLTIKPPEDKVDGLISDVITEKEEDLHLVYSSIVSAARQIKPDFKPYTNNFDPHATWGYRVEDADFTPNPQSEALEMATTIGSIAFTWQWQELKRCEYEWDELTRVYFNGCDPSQ